MGLLRPIFTINRTILVFTIINCPPLDGDVPRATSYGVYISKLIRFARAWSSASVVHVRNRTITDKQDYKFFKPRKTFSKFYYRNIPLISKYKCYLKSFLRQGISHPEFYGDVIYKLRKILGHVHFENRLYKRINSFLKKDYDLVILQRTSRLVNR